MKLEPKRSLNLERNPVYAWLRSLPREGPNCLEVWRRHEEATPSMTKQELYDAFRKYDGTADVSIHEFMEQLYLLEAQEHLITVSKNKVIFHPISDWQEFFYGK